jgi:hypothetical protein
MSAEDLAYFATHGVEANLSEVIGEVAKAKPADPYKFIAEAMLKLSAAAQSAPTPEPEPQAKKKVDKKPAKKAEKAKSTAITTGPKAGGGVEAKKADDLPLWYDQVIKKSELIEGYPVKGCFTLRPWSYRIWELISGWFDTWLSTPEVQAVHLNPFPIHLHTFSRRYSAVI